MSALDAVRGQAAAISVLRRSIADRRLASAYLFHGPSGVGKTKTAVALATDLIAGDDETLRERIAHRAHPDVRVFAPRDEGNRNIQVEFIRSEILPFTQFAPFEASCSFVLFPEADVSFPENHPEAANALLKTLEEPRPNVHFILLAERPNRLLRTIRSRCQLLRFAPLPAADLDAILAAEGIPDEARPVAIALASGRADRALALARSEGVDALFDRALALHTLSRTTKPGSFIRESERLSKLEDDALSLELEAFALVERDLLVLALDDAAPDLVFGHRRDALRVEAGRTRVTSLAARESSLRRAIDSLASNVNTQAMLDALFFELARFA